MHYRTNTIDTEMSVLGFPFHSRQSGRSTSTIITAFAAIRAGSSTGGIVAAAPGTAKPGKPQRDLAEQHRDHMVPVTLYAANLATA